MPDEQELDLLIDAALSTYAEHRTGLESRVLQHLEARPTRKRWLPFAIALPIAACAILLAFFFSRTLTQPPAPQAHNAPAASQPNAIIPTAPTPHQPILQPHRKTTHTAPQPAPLPKLDIFPTPQPLSSEEQALVHYAALTPASQIQSLQDAQQKKDEPLHIAEIQIQPIEPLDKPGN